MGSIARDQSGNIALGYSRSSATSGDFPSIYYAGQTAGDPLGTTETEVLIKQGTASQPDTDNRWGDYSSMALDGADSCTFWYTNEYYPDGHQVHVGDVARFAQVLGLWSLGVELRSGSPGHVPADSESTWESSSIERIWTKHSFGWGRSKDCFGPAWFRVPASAAPAIPPRGGAAKTGQTFDYGDGFTRRLARPSAMTALSESELPIRLKLPSFVRIS